MKSGGFSRAIFVILLMTVFCLPVAADAPRPFDSASWQQLTGAYKGRPVIVHFWGLTCGNCMVELKEWGRFVSENRKASVVMVNWDRRSEELRHIAAALDNAGLAGLPSYTLSDGFEEKLRFAVDRDWMGELPYTRLIASDGTVSVFSGAADFAKLSEWLSSQY